MRADPRNIGYDDLAKVGTHYFGRYAPAAGRMRCSRLPGPATRGSTSISAHGKAKAYHHQGGRRHPG